MRNQLRMIVVSALVCSACYVEEPGPVMATNAQGELVEISPGVEVVADYNLPVFYADGFYWWNNGGIWYQSDWYGGGWYRARYVSPHLGRIGHPERFAHFRGNAWHGGRAGSVHHRPAPRGGGHRR